MLKDYFKAENLKHSHTVTARLFWMISLVSVIIPSFLIRTNVGDYQMSQFNWWYTTFYPMLILLSTAFSVQREKRLKNRAISALPLKFETVWTAKILYILRILTAGSAIVYAAEEIISRFAATGGDKIISGGAGFAAMVLCVVLSLWQIPFWLIIYHKLGFTAGLILGLAGNIGFGVLGALSKWWLLNPFSYISRLMCPVLKVLPNGLLAVPESQTYVEGIRDASVIPRGVAASLVLFLIFYVLTAKWYQRKGGKGWEN